MKYLLTIIISCLMIGVLFGQTRKDRYEEPYPAPVSYENISERKAEFIALFEDRNVGNLHLFTAKKLKKDRTFKGEIIPKSYKYFFPSNTWKFFNRKKWRPRALYSIRGDAEDWYILRVSDKKGKNTLRLYEWGEDHLVEKKILAYTKCRGKNCEQLDSWIRDIDGDTNLDIVQRKATISKNQTRESSIEVFAIDEHGVFQKTDDLVIDSGDYQLEQIKTKRK